MTTATRSPKTKKPLAPVQGLCKWLVQLDPMTGFGLIRINGRAYSVTRTLTGYNVMALEANEKGERQKDPYFLPMGLSSCGCPDGRFRAQREGGCKHRRALKALGLKRGS